MKDLNKYSETEKIEFARSLMNNLCRNSGDEATEEEIKTWISENLETKSIDVIVTAAFNGQLTEDEARLLQGIVKKGMLSDIDALKLFLITRDIEKVEYYSLLTREGISIKNLLNDAIQEENGNDIYSQEVIDSFKIVFWIEKEDLTVPVYILSPADVSSMASSIADRIMQLTANIKDNNRISREWLLQACTASIVERVTNKFHAVKDKDSIEINIKE